MNIHKLKYLKYKKRYLDIKYGSGLTNNQSLAKYLFDLMKKYSINNTEYAVVAGYAVAQITGRRVTDLDVFVSKKAYGKLLENAATIASKEKNILMISEAEISKTPRLFILSDYGEIEFFEREDTGFPSVTFSLNNLKKNKMLKYDEFGNPYLNTDATILYYSDVRVNELEQFIIGDNYIISEQRLYKNISHLHEIYEKIKTESLKHKIDMLLRLYYTHAFRV